MQQLHAKKRVPKTYWTPSFFAPQYPISQKSAFIQNYTKIILLFIVDIIYNHSS